MEEADGRALVVFDNVCFAYGATQVLRGISFELPRRSFMGLVGANGSGKSTIMKLLLGLLEADSGRVEVLGHTPREAARSGLIGYVPQRESYRRDFPLSVHDVVLMGRSGRIGLGRTPCRADRAKVCETLERLGVAHLERNIFGELSGGQQRLVLLARALAQDPKVLFMDEADTGLDEERRAQIYHQVNDLRRTHDLSILAISHQLDLLAHMVDEAVALRDGVAVEWCPECMHHPTTEPEPRPVHATLLGAVR
jgi:manganese transport system ATP-binding protein